MNYRTMTRTGLRIVSVAAGCAALVLAVGVLEAGCSDSGSNGTGTGGNGGRGGSGGSQGGSGGSGGSGGAPVDGGGGDGALAACKDEMVQVSADVTTNTTWECNSYVLTQKIHITNNATLTIAAGSTVYGNGNATSPAALISTREGRLVAVGTADRPIVFSSFSLPGQRLPGDTFAGLVLLGKARINNGSCQMDPNTGTPACEAPGYLQSVIEGLAADDPKGQYGGTDDAHNCGELKYVRIEFAGFIIGAANELNGLTVGGCGTGTKLSYIQVHRGLDDGIEFFGGTAGIDHAIVSGVDDDGLDWDFGWTGKVQFLVIHQAYGRGDKGFESDNNVTTETAEPRSKPEIWNATMIGESNGKIGMHLRRGTRGVLRNFIVQGFSGGAVDIDAAQVMPAVEWPAQISVESSVFFNNPLAKDETAANNDMGFDEAAALTEAARMNTTTADPMLGGTAIASPNYVPGNAAAVMGKATPPAGLDTTASYAGAAAPGTAASAAWWAGWTAFPEN